jgi:hypothetical protein
MALMNVLEEDTRNDKYAGEVRAGLDGPSLTVRLGTSGYVCKYPRRANNANEAGRLARSVCICNSRYFIAASLSPARWQGLRRLPLKALGQSLS